jgi:hypothetical protein
MANGVRELAVQAKVRCCAVLGQPGLDFKLGHEFKVHDVQGKHAMAKREHVLRVTQHETVLPKALPHHARKRLAETRALHINTNERTNERLKECMYVV